LALDLAARAIEPQLSTSHSAVLMERRVNGAAGGEESPVSSEVADAEQEDVLSRLLQMDQYAMEAAVRDQLQSQIATMLRVSPEQLAVDAPLVSLGMDSLLAVELMFHVMRTYRIKLDFASLMTVELSIATLAVIVTQHVQEGSTSLADIPGSGEAGLLASPLDPDSGEIDIDSLSDAEVDAALARLSQ
jgi:acyl carrier protein